MRTLTSRRPLALSLSRFASSSAMLAAMALACTGTARGQITWDGDAAPTPGDGFLWSNVLNWQGDLLPGALDSLIFGEGTVGTILLNGDRTANSISFDSSFTLGTPGTSNLLTNTAGTISVADGFTGTLNARLGGTNGLVLNGGGTLYLSSTTSPFTGNIQVSGLGTSLMISGGGMYPQVSNTGAVSLQGRQDILALGASTALRTVTLSDGGELKVIGSGANPDSGTKAITLGTGGGVINVAAGYQQFNLDDGGQLGGAGNLTKAGPGRLTITTQDYNLTGNLIVNGGVVDFGRTQAGTGGARFSAFSATSTLTVNGGMLVGNGNGAIDHATTVNTGGILAYQGAETAFGLVSTAPVTFTMNEGSTILARDAFNPQGGFDSGAGRFGPRFNARLAGSGTVQIYGSTGTAGPSRVIFQTGNSGIATAGVHTFTGTLAVNDNAGIEHSPRNNSNAPGKAFGDADIDLKGYNASLIMRDDGTGSNQVFNAGNSDYQANDIIVSTTQPGSRVTISADRMQGANTNNTFNFGTLTIGDQRLIVSGINSNRFLFNNLALTGNPLLEVTSTANSSLNFGGVINAPARTITKLRDGTINFTNATNTNLNIVSGGVGISATLGSLTGGSVTVNGGGFGSSTAGTLLLDNLNAVPGTTAFVNPDRVADTVPVTLLSNSTVRLNGPAGGASETLGGTVTVGGHTLFDVLKTGATTAPIALQLGATSFTLGTNATANFTGANLGAASLDSTRIVLPGQATSAFLGSAYHAGAEWAKYDAALDNGFALGVQPFTNADYGAGLNALEADWASGMHVKLNGATGASLIADRTIDTLNVQFTAPGQSVAVGSNVLTVGKGGILADVSGTAPGGSTLAGGITSAGTSGALTAGDGLTPASLFVQVNNDTLDLKVAVRDNFGPDGLAGGGDDQPVTLVKSGTGTLRLTHQSLGVGVNAGAIAPFTAATYTGAFTGGLVINDGVVNVHRGAYLNGQTVTLNGGSLEINHGVANAAANTILPGWGNNLVFNGNAVLGLDDNAESDDTNSGDNAIANLGTLTINGGHLVGMAGFGPDASFTSANFSGTPTLHLFGRSNQSAFVNRGVQSGSGFDVVANNINANTSVGSYILGGGVADTAANTFAGPVNIYGAVVRLNKANGTDAISSSASIVVNGGTLAWGPGHHGDFLTTNNPATANNGLSNGLAPVSPATALAAGQDQIADTATVTLLSGALGESDRINTDKWGTLIQKNGTLNVGLGVMAVDIATISGGALNMNNGGTFKAGALNLLSGAYSPGVTTGLAGSSSAFTTLEIGAGGLQMSGQNITLASGSNGNFAGAGAVLKLGGDVVVNDDSLNAGSYLQGIYIQLGSSFRELGASRIDLGASGARTFTIDPDVQFFVTAPIVGSSGITKAGGGSLTLQPMQPSGFTGGVTVGAGVLSARGDGAFGTSAGGVIVSNGGTIKLESGWSYGDDFVLNGGGAIIPGSGTVREIGALISLSGTNRVTGAVTLGSAAAIASDTLIVPAAQPASGNHTTGASHLVLANAGGISGTGTLTLAGSGDGTIIGGINTASATALVKEGAGRWTISGAGSSTGAFEVRAGALRITHASALGSATAGTTVYGGASLEVSGGISSAEPISLHGGNGRLGALVNISGSNAVTGAISLGSAATISSESGTLTLGEVGGAGQQLTIGGDGDVVLSGALATGTGTLSKTGAGRLTLSGNNSFSGATTVTGGTLSLDYSVNNGPKLASGAALNLNDGLLQVVGNAASASTQVLAGLNLIGGGSRLTLDNANSFLDVGAISRTAGATLDSNPGVLTSTANVNGILGAYATIDGADWAATSGTALSAFSAYTSLATSSVTDNALLTGSRVGGAVSVNTLKIGNGAGVAAGTGTITLAGGGLLYTGAGNAAITGTGVLSTGSAANEMIVHTSGGTLDISTPVIGAGAGGLTKGGAGTLFLSGSSTFTGPININDGTLSIIGTGGTHPAALGAQTGVRDINLNSGTFRVLGDYNFNLAGANNMRLVVNPGGGTLHADFGGAVLLDDANQFAGSGRLTLTGGGRVALGGTGVNFPAFTGTVVVDGGILSVPSVGGAGGRAENTITLRSGTALINSVPGGVGVIGLPNDLVLESGVEVYNAGGDRGFTGNIQLSGTNTFALLERDNVIQSRAMFLTGRVSGTGVTINVVGAAPSIGAIPLHLSSGSNDLTGTMNIGANATVEARMPGSIGTTTGGLSINLNGSGSRLLLRHYQNGDYLANVVMNDHSELNSATLVSFGASNSNVLSINNLTINNGILATLGGGNAYTTRVAGTANLTAATNILSVSGNVLFENTLNAGTGAIDKRGGGSLILRDGAIADRLVLQGGATLLRGTEGSLAGVNVIDLRGGELRVENGDGINTSRFNSTGSLVLAGGTLRVSGEQNNLPDVSVPSGQTTIIHNLGSETVPTALNLTGFDRSFGSAINFSNDFGPQVGATVGTQVRVSSRITIPDQAPVSGINVIPWAMYNGNDFIQYSTALDSGVIRGVTVLNNNGATGYNNDPGEATYSNSVIARLTGSNTTTTLAASRSLQALKIDGAGRTADQTGRRLDLAGFNLNIASGALIHVNNTQAITNASTTSPSSLSAGTTTSPAELAIWANAGTLEVGPSSTNGTALGLTGEVLITNNSAGGVVSLVKNGGGALQLRNQTTPSTFSGGIYLNGGTLETFAGGNLGPSTNSIQMAGGTLVLATQLIGSNADLTGYGHSIKVVGNTTLAADNGPGAGVGSDHNYALGNLEISGPYTLGLRGFDSMDVAFTGASFSGMPTLDFAQLAAGTLTSTYTIGGAISGSGFYVASSGNVNDTAAALAIGSGAGDLVPNTYSGKLVTVLGSNSEDLRIQLNKAPNTAAVTGDLELNGGLVSLLADDQIADTSTIVLNQGSIDFSDRNETFAGLVMRGGNFRTDSGGGATINTVRITGNVDASGATNFITADGIVVNSNSTLTIDGTLKLNGFSRALLGASGATLNLGGLELTGTTVTQNTGAGNNVVRLIGDVTTFASTIPAQIGVNNDSDTFLDLNGTRTFNVADGGAGLDLLITSVIRNSTAPVATGGLIKAGPGVLQLGNGTGSTVANTFNGPVSVNEGTLILNRNTGANSLGAGALSVGDGIGGSRADKLVLRASNQIADAANVSVSASGVIDMDSFNTSETIGSLSGAGAVDLGGTSTLTVTGTTDSEFSGSIRGGGAVTKGGASILILSGASDYLGATTVGGGTLLVNGSLSGSQVAVSSGASLGGNGAIDGTVVMNNGSTLAPGNAIGQLDTGSLTFNAATFALELNGPAAGLQYDQLNVTGSFTLNSNVTLNLSLGYDPVDLQDTFTIVLNDGADAMAGPGLFVFNTVALTDGATFNAGGQDFSISYTGGSGNDVVLTAVPEPGSAVMLLGGLGALVSLQRFRRTRRR